MSVSKVMIVARLNDDWDDYQSFHRRREHLRLYGPSYLPDPVTLAETQALSLAA